MSTRSRLHLFVFLLLLVVGCTGTAFLLRSSPWKTLRAQTAQCGNSLSSTIIQDGTMSNVNWTYSQITTSVSAGYYYTSGFGNPAPSRYEIHSTVVGPESGINHKYTARGMNPATEALARNMTKITMSFNYYFEHLIGGDLTNVGIVVYQGSRKYRKGVESYGKNYWKTSTHSVTRSELLGQGFDLSTAGATIYIGYYTSHTWVNTNKVYSDNFTVTVQYQADCQCSDGSDNDGDGNIDYPNDPGCSATSDDDEYNAASSSSLSSASSSSFSFSGTIPDCAVGSSISDCTADSVASWNGHCYAYYPCPIPFEDATRSCEEAGGYLATITSDEENTAVHSLDEAGWIGLHDRTNEGDFQWVTGEAVTYENWEPYTPQPDNADWYSDEGEDCAENYHNGGAGGWWNDYPCDNPWHWSGQEPVPGFICEYDTVTGFSPRSSSSSSKSSSVSSLSRTSSSSLSSSSQVPSSSSAQSSVSSAASPCGNGIKQGTESCDDGNLTNGDGCSNTCQLETGWNCSSAPSFCYTLCGDGFKAGSEQCDDGNLINGDGCSSYCQIQALSASSSSSAAIWNASSISAQPLCGNGRLEIGEQCETNVSCGNGMTCAACSCVIAAVSSSSRSSSSMQSSSYSAVQSSATSTAAVCGNGVLETGEQCERNVSCSAGLICMSGCQCASFSVPMTNSSVSSASSAAAIASSSSSILVVLQPVCGNGVLEEGEQCDQRQPCAEGMFCSTDCQCLLLETAAGTETSCGNGMLEEGEGCDDGNLLPLDGCSFLCQTEAGYSCFEEPSMCQPVCGDSVRIPPEECDDGNLIDGDGCSSVCEKEFAAAEASSSEESSSSSEEPIPLPACGNGILEEGEECDDANPFEGDGCSATCVLEQISSVSSASSTSSLTLIPITQPDGGGFPWWWLAAIFMAIFAMIGLFLWKTGKAGNAQE